MKKLFLTLIFILLLSSHALADDFCDGWHDGYIAGYCHGDYGCLEPLVPLCPLRDLGEDTYQDGYNRGFLAGHRAKS